MKVGQKICLTQGLVEKLRNNKPLGEKLYWVVYATYMTDKQPRQTSRAKFRHNMHANFANSIRKPITADLSRRCCITLSRFLLWRPLCLQHI